MKKIKIVLFSLFFPNCLFSMRQVGIQLAKPVVAQVAVTNMPQVLNRLGKVNNGIDDYNIESDRAFVHAFILRHYAELACAGPVSEVVKQRDCKILQNSCDHHTTKVYRKDGNVVGFVTYLEKKPWLGDVKRGYIAQLGVDESVRGCGIGKKLMLDAEKDLMLRYPNLTNIDLMTTYQSVGTLYESLGYVENGDIEGATTVSFMYTKPVRHIPLLTRLQVMKQRFLKNFTEK